MLPEQVEALRRLGGAGRVAMIDDLNDAVRALMAAGVRANHPDWSEDQVQREVVRRVLDARS